MKDLIARALDGDRRSLARIISAVEDETDDGRHALAALYPRTGTSMVAGITGAPGAGKSTLTDHIVSEIRAVDRDVAVVAVDPSSPFTGGAILGDRVRMQDHIDDKGVYIRSLASRGQLGGLSEATPRVLTVLDAIGFDEIVVETVGVGQAEVEIAANADTTVVVVNPGWGDSVQAAKAGLLEIGDIFVVNKADRHGADEAVRDLRQMLDLGSAKTWAPPVLKTVATTGDGSAELWKAVAEHRDHLVATGELTEDRAARTEQRLRSALRSLIEQQVASSGGTERYEAVLGDVVARRLDPWAAARQLLEG